MNRFHAIYILISRVFYLNSQTCKSQTRLKISLSQNFN